MISGMEKVISRRVWFVPNFVVWGLPPTGTHRYLALEEVGGAKTIYYGSALVSQSDQEVPFDQLIDHRGNNLPSGLSSPRVFPRAKGEQSAFVVGRESSDRFKIAHSASTTNPVTVDLLVVEVGD